MVTESKPENGKGRNQSITYGDLFERLGGTNPVHQVEWLLEFAQQDLSTCSDQELSSLCELFPLIGLWDVDEVQRVATKPISQFDWIAPYTPTGLAEAYGSSLEEARKSEKGMKERGQWLQHKQGILYDMYQKPLGRLFHGLLTVGQAVTDEIHLRLGLRKGALIPQSLPDARSPHEIFIYRAAQVIQQVADRLIGCANSQCDHGPHHRSKVFIQSRRDQVFCSDSCGSRTRMERMRKREEAERQAKSQSREKRKGKPHGTKRRH